MTRHPARLCALSSPGQEPQRRQYALPCLLSRDVATLDADRIRREPKADCGDAGVRRRRVPVRDQSVLRIAGLPEEPEGTLLQLHEEGVEDSARDRRDRL